MLRYLKAMIDAATKIIPNNETQLKSWVDASWEGETGFERRYRIGMVIKCANVPVYTATVLQKCTALSSTEAEFIDVSE